MMQKILHTSLVLIAVVSVAIADIFIKKATENHTVIEAFSSLWMIGAIILYLLQVVLFTYMFLRGWDLSMVGTMQTVFYSAVVLAGGYFLYKESINPIQLFGITIAFIGVMITNIFAS